MAFSKLANVVATGSTTTFDTVMDAATDLVSWGGELFNTIIANPVLVVFVASSFVGVGLGIVSRLKATARG